MAEAVGTNPFTVTRWEQGRAFPNPHFRQRLAELFAQSPEALGLAPSGTLQPDPSPAASPQAVVRDPLLPPPMASTAGLMGREYLLAQLKAHLLAGNTLVLSVLQGLPGVGKTALALALAHDPEVQAHFADGILWTGLGQTPHVPETLTRWGTLLGLTAADAARLSTPAAWAQALRTAIDSRRLLFVLDDAWSLEEVLACQVGGIGCAYLITTRRPDLALQGAGADVVVVPELEAEDGLALLARLAPIVVETEPEEACSLVQAIGGLPLGLVLLGKYLHSQSYGSQPRRIRAALERLQQGTERLRLAQPQAPLSAHPSLPAGTPLSLQASIDLSVGPLPAEAQAMLAALALFPPKPNSFSEEAALAVSAGRTVTLDALGDAGLVESSGPGRYTLHQTIVDYARVHLPETSARPRFAHALLRWCVEERHPDQTLEQEQANLWAALDLARDTALDEDFVRGFVALCEWARRHGKRVAFLQYGPVALELAERLGERRLLGQVLRHLSHFAESQGQYDQATTYATEAMEHAEASNDAQTCQALQYLLGTLALRRADLHEAQYYLLLGVTSARQLGDVRAEGASLVQLGATYSMSQPEQAKGYYEEALALAHHLGDRSLIASCMQNLGVLAGNRGDYAEADHCFREVLTLARQMTFPSLLSDVLNNLGQLALEQGRYEEARAYLTEALPIALRLGHRYRQCALLGVLGEVAAHQQHMEQALTYLEEGVSIARTIGHRQGLGNLLANQCSVRLHLGELDQVKAALAESTQIAQESEHHVLLGRCWELAGRLALRQHRIEEAQSAFEDALRLAQTDGLETLEALAEYGLAQVAAKQGYGLEAVQHGELSLRLLQASHHATAPEVEGWLETIRRDKLLQNGHQVI